MSPVYDSVLQNILPKVSFPNVIPAWKSCKRTAVAVRKHTLHCLGAEGAVSTTYSRKVEKK